MDEKDILKYLYDKDNKEHYTDLLNYFMLKYPNPDYAAYRHIVGMIRTLLDNRFITLSPHTQIYDKLGNKVDRVDTLGIHQEDFEILTFHILQFRRDNRNIKNDGIQAKITWVGKKEIEDDLFKEQLKEVNQSVINTNRFSRWILLFTGLTTIFIASQAIYQWTDTTSREVKGIKEQLQKTQIMLDSVFHTLAKHN